MGRGSLHVWKDGVVEVVVALLASLVEDGKTSFA